MRKTLSLVILILLTAATISARQELTPSVDMIDFGIVPQDADFCRTIILRSTGDDTVEITDINTFCPCIQIHMDKMKIPPGDSAIVDFKFNSSRYIGQREWRPHFYRGEKKKLLNIRIIAFVLGDPKNHRPIYVYPHTISASQFGDQVVAEFPIQIINESKENVPLELKYSDEKFFDLDFPVYIPPNDTAKGKIILNEEGIKTDFQTYITFEYIDENSDKHLYSVPIKRKVYRPKE
jgi:hypothetical protein